MLLVHAGAQPAAQLFAPRRDQQIGLTWQLHAQVDRVFFIAITDLNMCTDLSPTALSSLPLY